MGLPLALPRLGSRRKIQDLEQRMGSAATLGAVSGYGSGGFGNVITNNKRFSFGPTEELDAFHASEVIYRCADMNASAMAALDVMINEAEKNRVDDTAALFNQGSTSTENAVTRKYIMYLQAEMKGESFTLIDRELPDEKPRGFSNIWGSVSPVEVEDFEEKRGKPRERTYQEKLAPTLAGYKIETDYGAVGLLPYQVLWIRYPHYNRPWAPMAPADAAKFSAELISQARKWQMGELLHGARPSGVYNVGDVTPEDAQRAKAALEAQTSGAENAGRTIVTYGPTGAPGFSRISLTPAEMSYLDSNRQSAESIAIAMGVPIELIYGQSTFNNQNSAYTVWWEKLKPKLRVVEAELDRIVWPEPSVRAFFDLSKIEALQENTDAVHERARKAWEADGLTWGEYRARLGEEVDKNDPRKDMTITEFQLWTKRQFQAEQSQISATPRPDSTADVKLTNDAAQAAQEGDGTDAAASDGADPPPPDEDAPSDQQRSEQALEIRTQVDIAKIVRRFDRHERAMKRAVARMAEKQKNIVMKKLRKLRKRAAGDENPPDDISAIFETAVMAEIMREALETPLESVWTDAAEVTMEAVGSAAAEEFINAVVDAMRGRLDVLAEVVTETTRSAIEEELLKPGVEEGEGVASLAERVLARFEELKGYRAELISRTEVVGGSNQASLMAAAESGVVTAKRWLHTDDLRVRPSHRKLGEEHETVPLDQRFSNGCLFPGDPTAQPEEVCNCRCTLLYELEEDDR